MYLYPDKDSKEVRGSSHTALKVQQPMIGIRELVFRVMETVALIAKGRQTDNVEGNHTHCELIQISMVYRRPMEKHSL